MVYRYVWANNERRASLKNRFCRILARGKMNTVLVEFIDNGEKITTSGRALSKVWRCVGNEIDNGKALSDIRATK